MTLFTGQWADLPLDELASKAADWGYDGLELACWGDHFDVVAALEDDGYCQRKRDQLAGYGLQCWAISNHLVGQTVCDDPIDERHRGILPDRIWGDGDPEGIRRRAAEECRTPPERPGGSALMSSSASPDRASGTPGKTSPPTRRR